MLIIMTVDAEELPVAAVGWIVVMVVVTVVDGKFLEICPGELPRAAATYPGIHLERLFTVSLFTLFPVAPGIGDDPVELLVVGCFISRDHETVILFRPCLKASIGNLGWPGNFGPCSGGSVAAGVAGVID